MEFKSFGKLHRLSREIIVTEKIDGSNAQIYITDDNQLYTGSRNRWITTEDDNFGFAAWAQDNKEELLQLGPGRHFGEWYGAGIQRKYDLKEKRFALFNTQAWGDVRPACCGVVPVLYKGLFSEEKIFDCLSTLERFGSEIVPDFMKPEGIVIYHTAAGVSFKKTLENDDIPKRLVK